MHLFSFWTGPISWLEQMCINSMLAQGHTLAIYTYNPAELESIDRRVQILDASVALPLTTEVARQLAVRPSLTTNVLRYHLLERQAGTWVDLDVLLLKPLPDADYLLAYEDQNHTWINGAILRLPSGCPLLRDLIEFCAQRPVIGQWWPLKRKLKHRALAAIGRPIPPEKCKWGVFGPRALTYFTLQRGLVHHALGPEWFYPVPYDRTADLVNVSADIPQYFTSDTVAVHLWANRLRKFIPNGRKPPPETWLGRYAAMHA